jgi:predicted GIY-YIG superfamily endonuclease
MAKSPGVVYLLHLDRPLSPLHTAQHYLGWAARLAPRLAHHEAGTGARFTAVAIERGIAWTVARTWEGDRVLERRLKRRHEGPRLCPICRTTARPRAVTTRDPAHVT